MSASKQVHSDPPAKSAVSRITQGKPNAARRTCGQHRIGHQYACVGLEGIRQLVQVHSWLQRFLVACHACAWAFQSGCSGARGAMNAPKWYVTCAGSTVDACSSKTEPARKIGTHATGLVGSTNSTSALPSGVSTSPESVGSQSRPACQRGGARQHAAQGKAVLQCVPRRSANAPARQGRYGTSAAVLQSCAQPLASA